MAIPGYTPIQSEDWVKNFSLQEFGYTASQDMINSICTYLGVTNNDLKAAISSLITRVKAQPNMPLVIRDNGTIDVGLIYPKGQTPSPFEKLNVIGNVADYMEGMTWGIVDGVWTVFFGEAANLWISQAILPIPVEIPRPVIKLIAYDYRAVYNMPDNPPPGGATYQPSFAATYMTKYGESGPSNIIVCPLAVEWRSVTLGLNEEPPSLATKVYYYRLFNDMKYRRVGEVKL